MPTSFSYSYIFFLFLKGFLMSLRNKPVRIIAGVMLAAAATGVLAACGGSSTSSTSATASSPSSISSQRNAQDTMFLQMMIPHHEQAVVMSALAPSRTQNAAVLKLAKQIEAAQGPEIAEMKSWLTAWNEPLAIGDMGGMAHGGGSGMPGMMKPEQMTALEQAKGAAFDKLYLKDMIAHHEGAVTMAQQELDSGENPQVKALAQTIINAQTKEISEIKQMLG